MYIGGIPDPRKIEEKAKDWHSDEVLGKGVFDWGKTAPIKLIGTERNQNGSYECGAYSGIQALGRNNYFENGKFVDLLPNFIYQKRKNKGTNTPDGMYLQDLLDLLCKVGAPEDKDLSSDNKHQYELDKEVFTQEQINQALKYKGLKYVNISLDIDSIAFANDNGYTVIALVNCDEEEWLDEPVVTDSKNKDFHHFVPLEVPQLKENKKGIWFNDSFKWAKGKNGFKWMSEEFIKNRVVAAGYVIDLDDAQSKPKKYIFTKSIFYGQQGKDVEELQKKLVYLGFMPQPKQYGYFGNMTAQALVKYQVANGILDFKDEKDPTKIQVGKKTINLLNS